MTTRIVSLDPVDTQVFFQFDWPTSADVSKHHLLKQTDCCRYHSFVHLTNNNTAWSRDDYYFIIQILSPSWMLGDIINEFSIYFPFKYEMSVSDTTFFDTGPWSVNTYFQTIQTSNSNRSLCLDVNQSSECIWENLFQWHIFKIRFSMDTILLQ